MFCKYLLGENRKGFNQFLKITASSSDHTHKSLVLFLNAKMCGAVNSGGGGRLYWVIGGRCDWERLLMSVK
jgi:hypothetical protein